MRARRWRTRVALLPLTALAAVTIAGSAERPAAGHARSGRCQTTGVRVVADAPEVLVTAVSSRSNPYFDPKARFVACLKKTGARRRLLDRVLKTRFKVFPPRGRFVVAAAYDDFEGYVVADLVDVASGLRYELVRDLWEPDNGTIKVVLLKRNGSVAFLRVTEPDILYRCEIRSCYTPGRRARLTELDKGRIAPKSVRLRGGSTIVWRNASGSRSAPLR